MLRLAMVFLVTALVAAALAFGSVADPLGAIARLYFFVSLILFSWTMLAHLTQTRPPPG